jgi:phospholipid/cholesterol/gamma-HCH transport system permease protein
MAPAAGAGLAAGRPTVNRGSRLSRSEASASRESAIVSLGRFVSSGGESVREQVDFLGSTLLGIGRLFRSRAVEPRRRFVAALRDACMGSLPIVALIGFVAGLVLTLLGSKELGKIGVEASVPRLVGIVVLREIGVLITGIALAGRVASSYAAEIAAANASGETSALRRSGLDPLDVEVAPRVLALVLAAPVLLAYANLMAVVGSAAYGAASLGAARELAATVVSGLPLKHALSGLVKAGAFGFVVAWAGCFHGLRSSGTPGAIGSAVRRAVVAAVLGVGVAEVALIFVFKWIPI